MDIQIDEDWLKSLYTILIAIYKNTNHPIVSGLPIVPLYNENMLSVCVKRPQTAIYGTNIYPHVLQKAAILMHSIINFHPFVDGNKRAALISTAFFLHWNGYQFEIPLDADAFTIEVAKGHKNANDILIWLTQNSTRNTGIIMSSMICHTSNWVDDHLPMLSDFADAISFAFFIPEAPFRFFRRKIQIEQAKQLT